MAKLDRVTAKVFAASAAADEIGQFGSAVAGSKLETADVATIQALSAWLDGWSEALVSGNRYPALQEMNGLLKVLSYQGAYALQEGIPEYDSDTTYYTGSIVKKTGTFELYGSLTDDNVGNALVDGANWQYLGTLSSLNKNAVTIGTCSTASATAEKAVTATGFTLTRGAMLEIVFTNANTSATPTLNINSGGAITPKHKNGQDASDNYPMYFPSGCKIRFYYDGTSLILQNEKVESYINSTYLREIYSDGKIIQSGYIAVSTTQTFTVTLPTAYKMGFHILRTNHSGNTGGLTNASISVQGKDLSSFVMDINNAYHYGVGWRTEGY